MLDSSGYKQMIKLLKISEGDLNLQMGNNKDWIIISENIPVFPWKQSLILL